MDMSFTRLGYMSSTSGVLCETETAYLSRIPLFHPQFFLGRTVMYMFLLFYDMCFFFRLSSSVWRNLPVSLHCLFLIALQFSLPFIYHDN